MSPFSVPISEGTMLIQFLKGFQVSGFIEKVTITENQKVYVTKKCISILIMIDLIKDLTYGVNNEGLESFLIAWVPFRYFFCDFLQGKDSFK